MARPRSTAASRKTRTVIFRVTEAEFTQLAEMAAAAQLPLNHFARRVILARHDHVIIEAVAAIDPALLKRLDRIGHNLNQLVKRAHLYGAVEPEVVTLCTRIDELVDAALNEEARP